MIWNFLSRVKRMFGCFMKIRNTNMKRVLEMVEAERTLLLPFLGVKVVISLELHGSLDCVSLVHRHGVVLLILDQLGIIINLASKDNCFRPLFDEFPMSFV